MKVSFIIPAYNAEATIRAAVESALGQSIPPHEVVVADDASTDGTRAVLDSITNPRMRVVRLERNAGPGAARHAAMAAATGDVFACLDADDVAVTRRLELQMPVLEADASVMVVCGSTKERSEGGSVIISRPPTSPGAFFWCEYFRNRIATSTACIRRDSGLSLAGRFAGMRLAEDHAMWLGALETGRIASVRAVVAVRRIGSCSLSAEHAGDLEAASVDVCRAALSGLVGEVPDDAAYLLLRRGAAPSSVSDAEILERTVVLWCDVFDAVQRSLMRPADRSAAARESLVELRHMLRYAPARRYDVWRRTMAPRSGIVSAAMASVKGLRVARTMIEGR
jgi:hypothetical protein